MSCKQWQRLARDEFKKIVFVSRATSNCSRMVCCSRAASNSSRIASRMVCCCYSCCCYFTARTSFLSIPFAVTIAGTAVAAMLTQVKSQRLRRWNCPILLVQLQFEDDWLPVVVRTQYSRCCESPRAAGQGLSATLRGRATAVPLDR